jgi:hypothetical protein
VPGKSSKLSRRQVLEADRNKSKSICCGAGGGRMWMEEEAGHRVNEMRAGQLLEKQPELIGVNCPYCLTMMEDGIGTAGKSESVKAMDLAEILVAPGWPLDAAADIGAQAVERHAAARPSRRPIRGDSRPALKKRNQTRPKRKVRCQGQKK